MAPDGRVVAVCAARAARSVATRRIDCSAVGVDGLSAASVSDARQQSAVRRVEDIVALIGDELTRTRRSNAALRSAPLSGRARVADWARSWPSILVPATARLPASTVRFWHSRNL